MSGLSFRGVGHEPIPPPPFPVTARVQCAGRKLTGHQDAVAEETRLEPDLRDRVLEHLPRDVSSLGQLQIDTPNGGRVALGQVASITVQPSPSQILRENSQRYTEVDANVSGRSLGAVTSAVRSALAEFPFPRATGPRCSARRPSGRTDGRTRSGGC